MTRNMWALYQKQSALNGDQFSRGHLATLLNILAASPTPWKEKQAVILKQLKGLCQTTDNVLFAPTIAELKAALETASGAGLPHDATWLYNELKEQCKVDEEEDRLVASPSQYYLELWIQSIYNDVDTEGSLLYLESILLQFDSDVSRRLRSRRFFNGYLEKLAQSGMADAGIRAEAFFSQWKDQARYSLSPSGEDWHPDEKSVHAVAMAYLQAAGSKELQLSEARRFLAKQTIER